MKVHEINLYQEFSAPVDQVWEAFNDHANFGKMMGQDIKRVADSTDAGNVNGLGSVRSIKIPGAAFEETIVRSQRPVCIEYQITKGLPITYHYGNMQFKSLPDGRSALDYSVKLGLKLPFIGGLVSSVLKKQLGKGLAAYARRLQK